MQMKTKKFLMRQENKKPISVSDSESEGEWKSDTEDMELIKEIEENERVVPRRDTQVLKNPKQNEFNREEIIDTAMAKFRDVIKNSGLLETANLLKKQLDQQKQKS